MLRKNHLQIDAEDWGAGAMFDWTLFDNWNQRKVV
jgi:hypothetical protein